MRPAITGMTQHAGRVDVAFDPASLPRGAAGTDVLIVQRVGAPDGTPEARIYQGKIMPTDTGGRATARALETDHILMTGGGVRSSTGLSEILSGMTVGSIVAIVATPGGAVVSASTSTTYQNVPVRVIQDGSGRRAIIVPVTGGAAVSLATGKYRLSLAINRERWSTTDAPDALNRYQDSAQLTVTL
jgi:hypothetical protein